MSKFPEPPAVEALAAIGPEVRTLAPGTELWRIYFRGGRHPTTWKAFRFYGPTPSRFDHHLPPPRVQVRGILYAALHGITCLAEVFQENRLIDRSKSQPWIVALRLDQALHLLDLTGTWPTRAGASMAISTGNRPRAQRWSQAIYETYPDLHGLYYPSSMHANSPSLMLSERARAILPTKPSFHRALDDPTILPLLRAAAEMLGYGLA